MAKDDYFVIVYQILAYLYQRLKKGEDVDERMLQYDSPLFKINKQYWSYIIYNMFEADLIENVGFIPIDGSNVPLIADLEDCRITPTGIEYLLDNSFMEKAKSFLKDISPTAYSDGAECISEVGVLIDRGDADKVPRDAMELFMQHIRG